MVDSCRKPSDKHKEKDESKTKELSLRKWQSLGRQSDKVSSVREKKCGQRRKRGSGPRWRSSVQTTGGDNKH